MTTPGSPTTINPVAAPVDIAMGDAMKTAEAAAVVAAESALDAAVPLFALPVIKQVSDEIISEVIGLLGDQISVAIQTVGTFVIIDTQVTGEESGVSQALAALMVAEKGGNAAQIKAAIQAYANAQSALVHDNGSAEATT